MKKNVSYFRPAEGPVFAVQRSGGKSYLGTLLVAFVRTVAIQELTAADSSRFIGSTAGHLKVQRLI